MLYLFTYNKCKGLNIPPANNHLEGMFSRIKERVKIHRLLNKNRKKSSKILTQKLRAKVKKPSVFLIMASCINLCLTF